MFRLNELIAAMAQRRTFFDDVKKELDCSVCQEQFSATKEPKILKCLHTFCRDCLETWLARQREGKLSCPTCRQITECPNNDINRLPSNLFYKQLIDIVDAYSGGGVEDSPQCGNCEEKNYLKFYCSRCNCFLCEDCAGAHVKGKLFRGHQVKEIRNFQSSDVEDYARRANVCKKHDDEVRFFCVNCKICICRDCAVLEHQDHKKISIDEGLEINKSEIEAKMSEVQRNYSRLRTHREALEKRRQKLSSDIDGATREVKRVASCCVSLIRKHEENVLQQLVKQKEDLQGSFTAQTASLDGKLMEIESTAAFCEEVLLRKNLPEVLNVKTIIEERLRDLSLSSPEDIPKQDYSRVKYVSNDFSFAPGKLITSNTEPLLSVAEGKGVTEGIVGHDCSFTVITKDSASKDTYSEIDEVQVAITSVSSQHDVTEPVNMTLKDGRYTFSYRPTTPGEFTVSIKVAGTPIMGSPFTLTVKSQPRTDYKIRTRDTLQNSPVVASVLQHDHKFEGLTLKVEPYLDSKLKNGDQHFEVFEVVSATLCVELVESLSRKQSIDLLETIAEKTGVKWIESSESFIMSGTFKAVEESRTLFQQGIRQFYGIVVASEMNAEKTQPQFDVDQTAIKKEANFRSLELAATSEGTDARVRTNEMDTGRMSSITTLEVQSFEIEPKIVKVLVRAHKKDLDDIETEFRVEIPRQIDRKKISLKPKETCGAEDYHKACNLFINLYQQMYQRVKIERFSLKSEKTVVHSRGVISKAGKNFPVSIELSKDRKHYELYGEESHIADVLKYLKEEGVEIKREPKHTIDNHAAYKEPNVNEETMDVDPAEYLSGAKFSGNRLEIFLGRVKVSVLKGDITTQQVDVIVNAANERLQHDGGVAMAILHKGGKTIEEESRKIIKQRGTLRNGEAVTTNPGKLPCKAVVHVVGPEWKKAGPKNSKKLLRHACLNSFVETEKLQMTSIALPAIGSGIYGMPKNVCAEVMLDAVDEFVRQGDKKTIADIRLVDIDDPSVQAFRKEFITRYPDYQEVKANGEVSTGMSKTGSEGGSSTAPSRGRRRNKNTAKSGPSTMIPSDAAGGGQHHSPHSTGTSAANNNHPLSEAGELFATSKSYSSALKGRMGDNDGRYQTGGGRWRGEVESRVDSSKTDKTEEDVCAICLDDFTNPILKGNQPHGEMTTQQGYNSLPGFEGFGTIIINYFFPPGIQGPEHPNPGQRYGGTTRTAYLPDTRRGREVLQLLKSAFDARLVFTVGTSTTTGLPNQITWNDIHHKTNIYGGPTGFGYPDPDYLQRVKEELAAKGIR